MQKKRSASKILSMRSAVNPFEASDRKAAESTEKLAVNRLVVLDSL